MTTTEERLLGLLDGPCRKLKDDNHLDPHRVLVFEEAAGAVEAVELVELPLRHPIEPGGRQSAHDLGELVKDKAVCTARVVQRTTLPRNTPTPPECGTVCLVQHSDQYVLSWCQVRARIDPALNKNQ